MPTLAPLHPQIVHFVLALSLVGVALRWLSLTNRLSFAGPAATMLLLLGALGAVLAVSSGTAAHQPVEAIPGVGAAVRVHEDWGHRARTVLLIVAAIELAGVLLARLPTFRRWVHVVSAVVGLAGAAAVFVAAQKGGELAYSYAGGPGLRTGDTADVARSAPACWRWTPTSPPGNPIRRAPCYGVWSSNSRPRRDSRSD